ncbi:retrograde transporter, partial [Moniliophthora roreri MCA 2997]
VRVMVNPRSAKGAWMGSQLAIVSGDITPPLASMDIRRSVTRTYLYELVEGESIPSPTSASRQGAAADVGGSG